MNYEPIENVRTDDEPAHPEDLELIKTIFGDKSNWKIKEYAKKAGIFLIIYFIVSLKQFDAMVYKIIPKLENLSYIYILLKGILLIVLYFVISNLSLARK